MPDREDRLEEELRELGREIEYPPTPDISRSVRGRIEAERNSESTWSRLPSARWAVAAAVVVMALSPFFSPAFRDAVSDLFVSEVASPEAGQAAPESAERGNPLPDSASSTKPEAVTSGSAESGVSDSPGDGDLPDSAAQATGEVEDLPSSSAARGIESITPGEANSRVKELLLLSDLGEPDEIYAVGRGGVMLVYDASAVTLTQRPGDIETVFPAAVRPGSEDSTVNGGRGYWRSSGVLFWERDGLSLRLRSGLAKEDAVRLAESAR